MEIKVAAILESEPVSGSEKLLKLVLDIGGGEKRQVVAGIAKKYSPRDLTGRQVVVLTNLEPRRIMGLESRGMILAARDENGQPIILCPSESAPNGSEIN